MKMKSKAFIKAIEYYLPKMELTNAQLANEFPDWSVDKIESKTGISRRYIASEDECASDLGVEAAKKLFRTGICKPQEIDFILFCTQSPDYFLPTSACVIQDRLNIPTLAGAFDFNLGCSGFVYGLGIAKGLIETKQANNVLLITAETYSKFIHSSDKSVRTLFGDAGAATLIQGIATGKNTETDPIGPFVYGTDGTGAQNLIVPIGGMRRRYQTSVIVDIVDENGNIRNDSNLYMNGPEIFDFSLRRVPEVVETILKKSGKMIEDINFFIFHQANKYMLEHLRKKIKIPEEKFVVSLNDYGNTVSCTIPIAIKNALDEGKIKSGDLLLLVGFGVGYSWGAAIVKWS